MTQTIPDIYRAACGHNLACIIKALQEREISAVTVKYEGFGDDGQIGEVLLEPAERNTDFLIPGLQDVREIHPTRDPSDWTAERVGIEEPRSLRDALDWYMFSLLGTEHPGWELNEGSFGSVTIDRNGAVLLFDDRGGPWPESSFKPVVSPLDEASVSGAPEPSPFGGAPV